MLEVIIMIINLFSESDHELEGLIPEVSDVDIKLLSIEPEQAPVPDEKQSFGNLFMYQQNPKLQYIYRC